MKIARPTLSLLCIMLMLHNLTITPVAADVPSRFDWQVERVEDAGATYCVNGFESGDIAFVWEDIPAQFFPLEVWGIYVWWKPPPGATAHPLAANVLLYDGATGQLRYSFGHVALMPGLNYVRTRIECTDCRLLFAEQDGPRLGVGIQYVTEFQGSVTPQSGHVVVDNEGCWADTNCVYDAATETWIDPFSHGLTGNFAIRTQFEPLCPEKAGDIDGDGDVDVLDFSLLQVAFTGAGGDAFSRPTIYSDLDNDLDVDPNDFAVFRGNFAGPDVLINCPDVSPLFDGDHSDIPATARCVPAEVPVDSRRWSYVQIAVALGITLVLYTLFIGPCIQATCRVTNAAGFTAGGDQVTTEEEDRIQAAIDFLGTMNDADSDAAYFFLAQPQYYNARTFQKIKINHSVTEDDTEFAASRSFDVIVLHHTFVTGDHWERWGQDGLVLLLFAEWQHIEHPGWSERQVQEWLAQWRERTGFEDVAPEFGHGFGD